MKKNKVKNRRRTLHIIYWLLLAVIVLAFISSFKLGADQSSGYCSNDILNSDQSQIELITVSGSEKVKKGQSFTVLIQNDRNDFATKYTVDVLKQNKPVIQKSGLLDGMISLNNVAQVSIPTSDLSTADYVVKAKLYHREKQCLIRMKEMNLEVISTNDLSTPNNVPLFDKGEVNIDTKDTQIKPGEKFNVTIANNFTTPLKYEIKVNDLETGDFVIKNGGTIQPGKEVGDWAIISTPGNHIAKIDVKDSTGNNLLYTERFNVAVASPESSAAAVPVPAREPGASENPAAEAESPSGGTTATGSLGSGSGIEVGVEIPGKGTRFTYTEYMCAFYRWALNIGFGLTLLMFIYAGYRYMTAAGNDAVFTDTKDILTSAILGFLLLLLIKLILNILDVKMPASCFAQAVSITRNLRT